MHATIDFAPPPGWRPRPLPTTLRRAALTAAGTARRTPTRRPPTPAQLRYDGPQDPPATAVELGAAWWIYAVAVVLFTVASLVAYVSGADLLVAVPLGFGWGVAFLGLCDFARRGAAR